MEAVVIATIVMISSVLVVNLGLGEAIAKVSNKILQCHTCLTFWSTMAALTYKGTDIIITVSLSIIVAYLSNFFGLLIMILNRLYTWLYGKENDKNDNRNKTD